MLIALAIGIIQLENSLYKSMNAYYICAGFRIHHAVIPFPYNTINAVLLNIMP